MREWRGFKVPCKPEKEWEKWMCGGTCTVCCVQSCVGEEVCKSVTSCSTCIYSCYNGIERREFYNECFPEKPKKLPKRDSKGRFCSSHKAPKLTANIFNRPDCPEWAQWAAVDASGDAYAYENKPKHDGLLGWGFCDGRSCRLGDFDRSDWRHSLIQRPIKELPKLTQTAFHSPDCPKEAATLKVFPANHVVALDKDNKVLQVMELQCKEGEIKKLPRFYWTYSPTQNKLYRTDDYRVDVPKDAYPVEVHYLVPERLVGKAVRNCKTGENYLISAASGETVELLGVTRRDLLSMVSLCMFYRFVDTGCFCCNFERL